MDGLRAALVLAYRYDLDEDDDLVLVIQRKHRPHGLALPGGMAEVGETYPQAALRELTEETGVIARPSDLKIVFSGPSVTNGLTIQTTTFELSKDVWSRIVNAGMPAGSNEGVAFFVRTMELLKKAAFPEYTARLFDRLSRT